MFDITEIITAVIGLLSAVVTAFLLPLIKSKTTCEQLDVLSYWSQVAVEAAEQTVGSGKGEEKKAQVKSFLLSKGLTYSDEEIDIAIESAVKQLKISGGESK